MRRAINISMSELFPLKVYPFCLSLKLKKHFISFNEILIIFVFFSLIALIDLYAFNCCLLQKIFLFVLFIFGVKKTFIQCELKLPLHKRAVIIVMIMVDVLKLLTLYSIIFWA